MDTFTTLLEDWECFNQMNVTGHFKGLIFFFIMWSSVAVEIFTLPLLLSMKASDSL